MRRFNNLVPNRQCKPRAPTNFEAEYTSRVTGESSSTLKTTTPEAATRNTGEAEVWASTDTLAPGLKNPSNIKAWWYGPSWWDAGSGPKIHDQDMIPETDGQRQYKLATVLVTGIVSAFVVLEADFGKGEHCFSPVSETPLIGKKSNSWLLWLTVITPVFAAAEVLQPRQGDHPGAHRMMKL